MQEIGATSGGPVFTLFLRPKRPHLRISKWEQRVASAITKVNSRSHNISFEELDSFYAEHDRWVSHFVSALQDKEAYLNLSLVEAREKLVAYSQASLPCLFKVMKVKKTGDEYAALARQFQSSANVSGLYFTSSEHLS